MMLTGDMVDAISEEELQAAGAPGHQGLETASEPVARDFEGHCSASCADGPASRFVGLR